MTITSDGVHSDAADVAADRPLPVGLRAHGPDILALTFLVLFPLVFLRIVPSGLPPYGGDVLVHVYPLFSLLGRGLHAGRPTLWNPYAAGGYPLAPYSALPFYPPALAALLLFSATGALAALYSVSLATLGVGTYLLAGDLGQSWPARVLAGVTLSCSGFAAAHIYAGHLLELGAVCPMPVAYLVLRRAILRRSLGYALGCGAVIGLMILAAGIQFLPFALLPLVLLVLWHAGRAAVRQGHRQDAVWPIIALVVASVVGALLSAVFLVPFLAILPATLRSGAVDFKTATAQSLPWSGLVMLVAPNALGTATADTYWPAGRSGPYFHEIYAYAGLVPLVLTPLALRRRALWPYGVFALGALLLALGANTPLFSFVFSVPGASLVRAPARAGLVLDFALALLAGFGYDALANDIRARHLPRALLPPVAIAAVVGVGLVATGFLTGHAAGLPRVARMPALLGAGRLAVLLGAILVILVLAARRRPRLLVVVPMIAVVDLFTANGALIVPTDPAVYFRATPATAIARADGGRVLSLDGAVPLGYGMASGALYDTQDAAPLALADYWRLSHPSLVARAGGTIATGRDTALDLDLLFLRLFGVRTLTSAAPLHHPDLVSAGSVVSIRWTVPGGTRWNAVRYPARSLVYRDPTSLPRLFTVQHATTVPSAAAALSELRSGAVDPAHTAILSPGDTPPPGVLMGIQRVWADWLEADKTNVIVARTAVSDRGGYLVVDDGWAPGWIATLDGQPSSVLRADDLLKAVRVPPGAHTVRLVYAPLDYLAGAAITLVTAIALACRAALTVVRRHR